MSTIERFNSGRVVPSTVPFPEGVRVGHMLYLSGQLGNVPGQLRLVDGGLPAEARQTRGACSAEGVARAGANCRPGKAPARRGSGTHNELATPHGLQFAPALRVEAGKGAGGVARRCGREPAASSRLACAFARLNAGHALCRAGS